MEILIFVLVILLASYFQSITGFGQGLIAAPIAFVLFDKAIALTALIVVGFIINLYLLSTIKARLQHKTLWLLFLGGLAGLPLGLIIVRSVSLPTLQLIVGTVSVLSAAILLLYKVKVRRRPLYSLIAGFFSGTLQTSTALPGPPVILLLAEENIAKQTMRKLLSGYFLIMGSAAFCLFIPSGLIETKGIVIGLIAAPVVILAGHAGNDEAKKIKQRIYKILVMFAIFIIGLIAIYEGLKGSISG